jgi:large subunit ribosomal protein L3
MWRVAHAGKMGFHTRTEINKLVIKIDADPSKVNAKGGFVRYGLVRNPYLLVKGSIPGPEKRFIKFTKAVRPDLRIPAQPPAIQYLSISSKQ